MLNTIDSKDNVKKVLKQIDIALSKKGIAGHQERLLRIYKTVSAIEKHSNCFVSKFYESGEDENENYFRTFEEVNKLSLKVSDDKADKVEFEFEDDDPKKNHFKVSMDDLLTFVEKELGVNHSDSSDDNDKTDSSIGVDKFEPKKDEDKEKAKTKEIQKKFLNIELKLRSFIRENEVYDIFSKSSFKSFVDDKRFKTPTSNKSNKSKVIEGTSPVAFNFFKEEELNKKYRYSHDPNQLTNSLHNFHNQNRDEKHKTVKTTFNFQLNKMSNPTTSSQFNQISKFCPDEDDVVHSDSQVETKHAFVIKRGSIFKDIPSYTKEDIEEILEQHSDGDEKSELSSIISPEISPESPQKQRGKKSQQSNEK